MNLFLVIVDVFRLWPIPKFCFFDGFSIFQASNGTT